MNRMAPVRIDMENQNGGKEGGRDGRSENEREMKKPK